MIEQQRVPMTGGARLARQLRRSRDKLGIGGPSGSHFWTYSVIAKAGLRDALVKQSPEPLFLVLRPNLGTGGSGCKLIWRDGGNDAVGGVEAAARLSVPTEPATPTLTRAATRGVGRALRAIIPTVNSWAIAIRIATCHAISVVTTWHTPGRLQSPGTLMVEPWYRRSTAPRRGCCARPPAPSGRCHQGPCHCH
jgi:hypothetical protein